MPEPLLRIENLHTGFIQGDATNTVVDHISLNVCAGETLALVGESGSGKSVTAHSILRLLPYPKACHHSGRILFTGKDLLQLDDASLRQVRGKEISMIFQEPMTALNPLHTVEKQIGECLLPPPANKQQAHQRVIELLQKVSIPEPEQKCSAYPHQLSGGQRQRVMIAMAIANNPKLLIADEPTTALDVSIQAEILMLLRQLQQQSGMAILLITHDLGVVRHFADRVAVMKSGQLVEQTSCEALFSAPQHPYTQSLLQTRVSARPELDEQAPLLLQADNISVRFPIGAKRWFKPQPLFTAVDQVCLQLHAGESLGVVGESGSGKSTLANALLKLTASTGEIHLHGQPVSHLNERQFRPLRQHLQVVFQDPFASLSPRMNIADIIAEGLKYHQQLPARETEAAVIAVMEKVGLDPALRYRYPHEFSGGQRQRIAIARALIMQPDIIILDEPTSALDRSVQFQVLDLLLQLQQDMGLSYLFISHDLKLVKAFCHHVLVMQSGRIVEHGTTQSILTSPREAYTRMLVEAALCY